MIFFVDSACPFSSGIEDRFSASNLFSFQGGAAFPLILHPWVSANLSLRARIVVSPHSPFSGEGGVYLSLSATP